jgi:hypothetical protein
MGHCLSPVLPWLSTWTCRDTIGRLEDEPGPSDSRMDHCGPGTVVVTAGLAACVPEEERPSKRSTRPLSPLVCIARLPAIVLAVAASPLGVRAGRTQVVGPLCTSLTRQPGRDERTPSFVRSCPAAHLKTWRALETAGRTITRKQPLHHCLDLAPGARQQEMWPLPAPSFLELVAPRRSQPSWHSGEKPMFRESPSPLPALSLRSVS